MNADVLTTRVVDALGRNLFLKMCISQSARMRSCEEQKSTSLSRSIEVETGSANHE
jgi:hypothetical protein